MNEKPENLLAVDEPAPVTVCNIDGKSPFLLVADHAGNAMPCALRRLGLAKAECERHIAWDIGIAGLGRLLADALDAALIQQNYSRLVIDCNRPPGTPTSIPEIGEHTSVPGNVSLSEASRAARAREIFWPYHERIEAELNRRQQAGQRLVVGPQGDHRHLRRDVRGQGGQHVARADLDQQVHGRRVVGIG